MIRAQVRFTKERERWGKLFGRQELAANAGNDRV
jgi:hypothetical protein